MNRKKQLDRMEQIVEAAVAIFIKQGYRRTQVSDIAETVGIAQGTVFNYFKTKEALFEFLIKKEMLQLSPEEWPEIPITKPASGSTLKFLKSEIKNIELFAVLKDAIARDDCSDPRMELETIVRQYFLNLSQLRMVVMLIESSVLDWPELEDVFEKAIRKPLEKMLKQYLDKRISGGDFRQTPDLVASVRLIIELINWFAKLRHFSTDAKKINDETAEETVLDAILQIFIPGTSL